jgi:hypothetical protein
MNGLSIFGARRGLAAHGAAPIAQMRHSTIHPSPSTSVRSRAARAGAGATLVACLVLYGALLGVLAVRVLRFWPLH